MSLEAIEIETAAEPDARASSCCTASAPTATTSCRSRSELDLRAVGPVRFVFPHAPTRPVTINGGYVMRAWYDILGTDLGRGAKTKPGCARRRRWSRR